MSIIQQIRERAAWLVFGLIALSLIGFLLMDAFVGRSRMFGTKSTVVGKINGQKIEYNQFEAMVQGQEESYKARGGNVNEAMTQSIRENVWNQMVGEAVLSGNYESLGLDVSQREIDDMLTGQNADQQIKQAFTDPKTGVFNSQAAVEAINRLRAIYKSGRKTDQQYPMAKSFFEEFLPNLIKRRMMDKYMSLLSSTEYIPKWMLDKNNVDNSLIAPVSYVFVPYLTVSDSTIKVSNDEIEKYVSDHKEQFKQIQSRSAVYVTYSAAPSSADSQAVLKTLMDVKKDFEATNDPQTFLDRVGSKTPFYNDYLPKSKIMVPNKDSIFALPKGGVFGPYLDGNNYVLAKKIDEKTMPDSVKARHILIPTMDMATRQPIMDDSVAKRKIDSIVNLINKGARFDSMARKFSADSGSAVKGGDLGWFAAGAMVPEFNEFCFSGKKGDKKVVKTQFGYHYIEILDQKNFEPAYKVAYLSKEIETSSETDNTAMEAATKFRTASNDPASFDQNVQKDKLQKLVAQDIQPAASNVPGLGDSRSFVKWLNGASLGEVSEPMAIGDKYVVAMVTEINKEGTMSAAKARFRVEPILRNRKKAEEIIRKLGNPATLDAAAKASAQQTRHADTVWFSKGSIPDLGPEPRVVGYAFDKSLAGKAASSPVAGFQGVFVIQPGNITAVSNPGADLDQQRFAQEQQQKYMIPMQALEELKRQATIKDYRGDFF